TASVFIKTCPFGQSRLIISGLDLRQRCHSVFRAALKISALTTCHWTATLQVIHVFLLRRSRRTTSISVPDYFLRRRTFRQVYRSPVSSWQNGRLTTRLR